jgi:hypothetical protein
MDMADQNLVVTVDDVGMSRGINRATAELVAAGEVSAGAVMTNFSATQDAFTRFRDNEAIQLGVHLNLSDGYPLTLSRDSRLVREDGRFRDRVWVWTYAQIMDEALEREIMGELRAQIEVFQAHGLYPHHLTSHTHFHALPALRELVLQLAAEYRVGWVRATRPRAGVTPLTPGLILEPEADTETCLTPDYVIALAPWQWLPPEFLLRAMTSLEGSIELVLHADDAADEDFPAYARYGPAMRYREMVYLKRLMQLAREENVLLPLGVIAPAAVD